MTQTDQGKPPDAWGRTQIGLRATRADVLGIVIRRQLKVAREAAGLTQEQMAARTGLKSSEQWNRIENGTQRLTAEQFVLAVYVLTRKDFSRF